jgi:signal peptidase
MEPAFHRGDLLFLTLPRNERIDINDICVFKLPERPIPIVHRVIKLHEE